MLKQAESTEEQAEQLLKLLDLQIAQKRAQKSEGSSSRVAVLVGGLMLLMVVAAAALMYLFSTASEMAHERESGVAPATETTPTAGRL